MTTPHTTSCHGMSSSAGKSARNHASPSAGHSSDERERHERGEVFRSSS